MTAFHEILRWCIVILALELLGSLLTDRAYSRSGAARVLISSLVVSVFGAALGWLNRPFSLIASPETLNAAALASTLTLAGGLRRTRCVSLFREFRPDPWLWGSLALWILLRGFAPDLWHPILGGEKFMDFQFLQTAMSQVRFPLEDPFFAGERLHYYFAGFWMCARWALLSGVPPEPAYFLAVATLGALLVGILARSRGAIGALLLFGGTLAWLPRAWDHFHQSFWTSSRVIPDVVLEYPFFSAVFGDLHPHLMGLPVLALFLIGLGGHDRDGAAQTPKPALWISTLLLSQLLAIHPWYFPVAAGLFLIEHPPRRRDFFATIAVVLISFALASPYTSELFAPLKGVAFNPKFSPAWNWMSFWLGWLLLFFFIPLRGFLNAGALRSSVDARFVMTAILIWIGTELFYIRDFHEGTWGFRQNTVFKFSLQAWLLLAIGLAPALSKKMQRGSPWARGTLVAALAVILLCSAGAWLSWAVYFSRGFERKPLWGIHGWSKITDLVAAPKDGPKVPLRSSLQAAAWLKDESRRLEFFDEGPAGRRAIVLEGIADYARWAGGRITVGSGVISVLGGQHAAQQHSHAVFEARSQKVDAFWRAPNARARAMALDALRPAPCWIVIGELEHALYGSDLDEHFEQSPLEEEWIIRWENREAGFRVYAHADCLPEGTPSGRPPGDERETDGEPARAVTPNTSQDISIAALRTP